MGMSSKRFTRVLLNDSKTCAQPLDELVVDLPWNSEMEREGAALPNFHRVHAGNSNPVIQSMTAQLK